MVLSQFNNSKKKNLTIYIIYYLQGDSTKHDRTKKHIILHLFNILKFLSILVPTQRLSYFQKLKFFNTILSLKNTNFLIEVFKT